MQEYEVIIRPKSIVEFESVEDLKRWLDRQKQPESAQEIARREQRDVERAEALKRYFNLQADKRPK